MFNSSEWGKIALNGAGLIAALRLLGFNWVLLPVFLLKLVPGVSVLPVWTTYTAYRAWRGNPPAASRRRGPPTEIIDAEIVEEIRPTNNNRL